jgi:hypothetical protein
MLCGTPHAHKEIRSIPDFYWSGVKLPIWFPAFLLAITCVSDVQMGHAKPILDIYVSIAFQWIKELFNPMGFDPCNRPLKIRESIGTPTSLGSVKVHSLTLFCTPESMKCDSCASFLARNLESPCLDREPKAKVAIDNFKKNWDYI